MPSKCATNSTADNTRPHLYEYAVVRFLPDIERGEFVNIGLVMMCKRRRWIKVDFSINADRIRAFSPGADIETLENQIAGFRRVTEGDTVSGGPIAALEAHERFRWLTAVRSAGLRTSRPHAGHTHSLDDTFQTLFTTLVL